MKTIDELRADSPSAVHGLTSKQVTEALSKRDIKHVIIGGHAMAAYGLVRNTEDVDVIAVGMEEAAEAIAACHGAARAVRQPQSINTSIIGEMGGKIADVIDFFQGAAFMHAVDARVVVDGVPVPTVDALIALKFESFTGPGRSPEKRHVDVADLMYLINKHHKADPDGMAKRVDFIGRLVERDSCGDPLRSKERWLRLHDDILHSRPLTF